MIRNKNTNPFYRPLLREVITHRISAEVLSAISESADSLGLEVYVVGGFVRDMFLGRPSHDLDLVTEGPGSGILLAKEIHKRIGKKRSTLSVFKNFGTAQVKYGEVELEFVGARRESYRANSRNPIVEDGTFEDDQLRRDFTINAMSVSLNTESLGEFVDPFGGLEDLERKIIRTPLDPDVTFSDDPLRMMRAVRFASQLGFNLPDDILDSIRRNASRIGIVSMERVMDEFLKIMSSPKPSVGLYLMDKSGLMEKIFPEIVALKGVETIEGRGHKENFAHTLMVVDQLSEKTDKLYLRIAALFHDIAKPVTKRFEKGVGWTFYNHNFIGARMIPKIFKRVKLPLNDKMKYVQKLVDLHMRPSMLAEEEITDSAIRRLLFEAGDDIDDLMMLCEADITSKNPAKVARCLRNFGVVRERLHEIEEKDRIRNFQPPLSGNDLMEIFGLEPGEKVGRLKSAIKEAILDGKVPNETEPVREYAHKLVDSGFLDDE